MNLALMRLLQLSSPTLPVGAYTYSQGLEWAVESGCIHNESSARHWIEQLLSLSIGRWEAPMLAQLIRAWSNKDMADVSRYNEDFLASRESMELRAETVQMGFSLVRLVSDLQAPELEALLAQLRRFPEVAFPCAWAGLAAAWQIDPEMAVGAYLWTWAENQVMAALKAVPLGQAAGQRLLQHLGTQIPALAQQAMQRPEKQWHNFNPAFAITCAQHETQYSRLFRS